MSSEARITELQNEANALRKQVGELKELLETELGRMRTEIQRQLSEAKEFLLSRESNSMARVALLETEVVKLTRVCEQALHKEELLNCLPSDEDATSAPRVAKGASHPDSGRQAQLAYQQSDNLSSEEEALSIQQSGALEPTAAHATDGVQSAIADLQGRLGKIYDFYTATSVANAELLHPVMHLSHFTAMVRDAGLCTARRPVLPELLWMAVMRGIARVSAQDRSGRRKGSTLLQPRVYCDSENGHRQRNSFARERLQNILRERFGEALYIAYCAALAHTHEPSSSLEEFRTFLLNTFLPSAEQRMGHREPGRNPHESTGVRSSGASFHSSSMETSVALSAGSAKPVAAATFPFKDVAASYAADDAVRQVVRQFTPHLKQAFLKAVRCPPHIPLRAARMSIEAFAECVRQHDLLPLLTRVQLKAVFLFCLQVQSGESNLSGDDSITYATFVTAMYCVAELIYGRDPALHAQYPSPRARLSKLFVKMFVL